MTNKSILTVLMTGLIISSIPAQAGWFVDKRNSYKSYIRSSNNINSLIEAINAFAYGSAAATGYSAYHTHKNLKQVFRNKRSIFSPLWGGLLTAMTASISVFAFKARNDAIKAQKEHIEIHTAWRVRRNQRMRNMTQRSKLKQT